MTRVDEDRADRADEDRADRADEDRAGWADRADEDRADWAGGDEAVGKHRYTTVMARIGGAPTVVAAPVCLPDADAERTDGERRDGERTDIVVLLRPVPERPEPDHGDETGPAVDEHPTGEVVGPGLERVPAPDADEPTVSTDPRRRWPVVAVAVAVLATLVAAVVVVIGAGPASPGDAADGAARPIPAAADAVPPRTAVFGESVRLADGWTVRIERPAALRDGEYAALPAGTDRAVRLLVTVRNDSEEARDSAGWSVKATAESRPVELLAAEGYAGAEAPSRTLLPGAALTLAVAVPMPTEPADLQLEAARSGRHPAIFVGRA